MKNLIVAAALALGLAPLSACGGDKSDEAADEKKSDEGGSLSDRLSGLGDKAKDLGTRAKDEAKDLGARAKDEAKDLGARAKDEAKGAVTAIEPYMDSAKGGIEVAILEGKQIGDKVEAVADAVAPLATDGVILKPIFQRVDDAEAAAKLDAAIQDMPRVEVIDGITVGFRSHSKKQYLVTWRKGDYLVGFVYTSIIDVAIGELIEHMPQLIGLVHKVM